MISNSVTKLQDEFIDNLNDLLMNDTKSNSNKLIATIKNPLFNVNKQIEYNDNNQFPLFICASFFLRKSILQTLLDRGADINAIDDDSNNILGYLIIKFVGDDDEDEIYNFLKTFNFLMNKNVDIYYINPINHLSIFDLVLELKQEFHNKDIEIFIEKMLTLKKERELIVKNKYYLFLLNSIFSKIGLIIKFESDTNEEIAYFGIEPIKCDTKYGIYLSVNENNDIHVDLLSNCKKNSGTTILSLIKKHLIN